ncbi:TrpR like protein, YerC/YecD [Brevundimonas sp. LM2]|uniref:YerC/YecD family TrpR-related protein n=1 Tax=Brevundimonas sp. LM2 TaxID=1938605 RepID=UPI000984059F|nr:YerC/YecD family TrpR-related protein [Brevundimonas sp. LM2]AQR62760.1 TrpR like protein, YerC/YecD [Brevundimonas sp. LM2]
MTEVPAEIVAPPPAERQTDDRVALYDALLSLKTRSEMDAFLADLCTPAEVRAFAERWAVARLLDQKSKSYREIAQEAGASPTTVVRVARFLKEMPHQGYRLVLDRTPQKA